MSAAMGFFLLGAQERVRSSRGKRDIVFEPLKFYCNYLDTPKRYPGIPWATRRYINCISTSSP